MVARLRKHPHFTAYIALLCVCFFWGTTYAGFRFSLESFPPATLVAVRNLISSALILSIAAAKGARFPTGRDLRMTLILGVLIIGVGNVALAIAERWIPTGLTSLFVTTSAFWYVGLDSLVPGGQRLHGPTIVGLLVGFAGVLMLVAPAAARAVQEGAFESGAAVVLGFVTLQISGASWAYASILQRNRKLQIHPFVIAGVQQAATAVVFGLLGLIEPGEVHLNASGIGGIVYLAIFGGIVGYGCYMTALTRLPLALVSIYTYVNPAVAVLLGWAFLEEVVGARELAAMAVIFTGVWLVRRASRGR